MQLSERLHVIRRELLTSATSADTHARASADAAVAQSDSQWTTNVADTAAAAQELGITPGGVAWLCRNGRLTAARCGGRWFIDTESLRAYQLEREER
ncbi:MAG: helix-turn-helix domain-containing protein [Mycobacterium sp.]|nr:helix-turn-helix domain-containing protein [Mycobacterium sp.]